MIHTLRIKGFRAFESLTLSDLSPVTLLVGPNNAGKSTVLEAFELLLGRGNPISFRSLDRRNEFVKADVEGKGGKKLAVVHLFHNHRYADGSSINIQGDSIEGNQSLLLSIVKHGHSVVNETGAGYASSGAPTVGASSFYSLKIVPSWEKAVYELTLEGGGLDSYLPSEFMSSGSDDISPIVFLDTRADVNIWTLWNEIVLGPEEQYVVDALRAVEPRIERIASISAMPQVFYLNRYGSSAGFVVKLKGVDTRLPLGSMGDGIRRLLEISICIANAAGGYLLVDEIDSGLHHSTMLNLWKMVVETARRLNVQVVATTHSADCLRALAELYEQDPQTAADTCVHRIEKDREHSVRFSASEIRAAVEQEMELR